jgi:hypothetical protein
VPTVEDESFSEFIGENDENIEKWLATLEE